MHWLSRVTNVFRRDRHVGEIDREIAFHIAEVTDRLVAEGMAPARAAHEAARRFGHRPTTRERTRDVDILLWLESLLGDIRYAVRALGRAPVFTLVAVLSLALGIGANTAIFSLLNAVILRSLPVAEPKQLVMLSMDDQGDVFTNPLWEEIRRQEGIFAGAFAFSGQRFNLAPSGQARMVDGDYVSGGFFSTLGIGAEAGRLLQSSDDERGCPAVAVAGYGFSQAEFGGAAGAVGQIVRIGGQPFSIIGVADRGFTGVEIGRAPQLYLPICTEPLVDGGTGALDERSNWWLQLMARIPPGSSVAQVRARLGAVSPGIFRATLPSDWGGESQKDYLGRTLTLAPAATGFSDVRSRYQVALLVLMAVVGVVLLIACANVANLLLARAAARQRELAMRMAIGASRARIIRHMLTESVLLSLLGGALGVLFARWSTAVLVGLIGTRGSQVALDLSLDGRVLGFTLLVAVLTGMLFGVAPAWRSVRVDPQVVLKSGGAGAIAGGSRLTAGKLLVVGQIAMSLVLVATAGLLLGTFRSLSAVRPGFDPAGVYLAGVQTSSLAAEEEARPAVARALLEELRNGPGAPGASASVITPVSGSGWNSFLMTQGFQPRKKSDNLVWFNAVSEGYFATLGTPIIAGRDFTAADEGPGPRLALINRALAARLFGQESPLGKTIWVQNEDNAEPPMEVIGVVEDAKYQSLRDSVAPTVYVPLRQADHFGALIYEVRSPLPPREAVAGILAAAHAVVPGASLEITTLTGQLAASLARERLLATLSGFFGGLALLLALIGQYGTMTYNVTRRRKELGIRVALGSTRAGLVRLVLAEVGRMVLIGLTVGALGTLAGTRLVAGFLYARTPLDPLTLGLATLAVGGVALCAGAIPAIRASREDPQAVLRAESRSFLHRDTRRPSPGCPPAVLSAGPAALPGIPMTHGRA